MGIRNKIRDRWPDLLGGLLLVLGLLGYLEGPVPYIPSITDFYIDIRSELVGIGIAVLIIDNANQMLATRKEKDRLIFQMGSPDNALAIEAVRRLKISGWLKDGSLRMADLSGADLSGADLPMTDLCGANLPRVDLSGAKLFGANLSGAYLRGAYLREAKLFEANLRGADLSKTNLSGADLIGADLREANLREANLSGAVVTSEQLVNAISLDGVTMPNGTIYDGRFDKKDE